MNENQSPRIIQLAALSNASGTLTYLESENEAPFPIQRVFWLYDLIAEGTRGGHAYRRQQQVIVAVAGGFTLHLDDGTKTETFTLDRPDRGVFLPARIWREVRSPTPGAVALILSSSKFDPDDVIDDLNTLGNG